MLKSRRRNATQTVQAVPLAASHVAFLRQMLCVNLTFRASTGSSEFGLPLQLILALGLGSVFSSRFSSLVTVCASTIWGFGLDSVDGGELRGRSHAAD